MTIYASVEGAKAGVLQFLREVQVPVRFAEVEDNVPVYNEMDLHYALTEMIEAGEIHINKHEEYVIGPAPRGRSREIYE